MSGTSRRARVAGGWLNRSELYFRHINPDAGAELTVGFDTDIGHN